MGSIIKKKILFGITSLTFGGAERVLVDIANKLSEQYDVTIFSIYDNGELKDELSSNVKCKVMYRSRYSELNKITKIVIPIKIFLFGKSIYKKKIKEDYNVEIAFLEGPVTRLFSYRNDRVKKIAWIHNDISKVFGSGFKSKIKKILDKRTYKRYDKLVFVSNDNMKSFIDCYTEIDKKNMFIIRNYIDMNLVISKADKIAYPPEMNTGKHPKFVTVCRLVKQKAIDRFIEVHSQLIKNRII